MEIGKVYVYKRNDRSGKESKGVYALRWIDPNTNNVLTRKTNFECRKGKKAKSDADRAAATLEKEINSGNFVATANATWAEFVDRYNVEKLSGKAEQTARRAFLVFNKVEKALNPKRVASITANQLSHLEGRWRSEGLSESTIASYFGQLKAALRWAERIGLIAKAPLFPKIDRAERAHGSTPLKGRGITLEELERMQTAAYRLFGSIKSKEWKRYLKALWLSGLRLEESYNLSWDEGSPVRVLISGNGKRKVARLLIAAAGQKNHQTILLPLAPDFSRWLLSIPIDDRAGRVFSFPGEQSSELQTAAEVGKKVSKLGKLAKVVVVQENGKASKFASAHDLRRSFGDRWSDRVMPVVLRQLMRHKSIETTLRYYVGKTAEDVEATCRAAESAIERVQVTEKLPKSYQGVYAD